MIKPQVHALFILHLSPIYSPHIGHVWWVSSCLAFQFHSLSHWDWRGWDGDQFHWGWTTHPQFHWTGDPLVWKGIAKGSTHHCFLIPREEAEGRGCAEQVGLHHCHQVNHLPCDESAVPMAPQDVCRRVGSQGFACQLNLRRIMIAIIKPINQSPLSSPLPLHEGFLFPKLGTSYSWKWQNLKNSNGLLFFLWFMS